MPTLFQRMSHFASTNKLPLQPVDKRVILGRVVMDAYQLSSIKRSLSYARSEEDTGTFKVVSYPPEFTDEMDGLIRDFYASNPIAFRPKRPRIKYKPKPAFTLRNQFHNPQLTK